ncbi:CotH kinase family protein [Flavobacteriales bacterium]|nr:CotH kinase family protein [Flavobacteriales bacterium]
MSQKPWSLYLLVFVALCCCMAGCINDSKSKLDFGSTPVLSIQLGTADFEQLVQLRDVALAAGVISDSEKIKFPCLINYNGKDIEAKIRFKGDWTDHLNGDKWSFRIELKGATILGKKTFSIQNPATRGFGKEWLIHKLFEQNEVLTTDYRFLPVRLNGKQLGLYAFEEHFEDELLEAQNRNVGVIFKYDESLFWECRIMEQQDILPGYFPLFEATEVVPFNKKRTVGKKKRLAQMRVGSALMESYRASQVNIDEYLDVEAFARFFAILTLANSCHGAVWHNQRMYVDPAKSRLEPIGFDIYSHAQASPDTNSVFGTIMTINHRWPIVSASRYYEQYLFSQEAFRKSYFNHLNRISDSAYISNFNRFITSATDSVNQLFRVEYPEISVDTSLLKKNAAEIIRSLQNFANWLEIEASDIRPDTTNYRPTMKDSVSMLIPIRAYKESSQTYTIENASGRVIDAVGFRVKKSSHIQPLSPSILIGIDNWQRNRISIDAAPKVKEFVYSIKGDSNLREIKVRPWPAPKPFEQ